MRHSNCVTLHIVLIERNHPLNCLRSTCDRAAGLVPSAASAVRSGSTAQLGTNGRKPRIAISRANSTSSRRFIGPRYERVRTRRRRPCRARRRILLFHRCCAALAAGRAFEQARRCGSLGTGTAGSVGHVNVRCQLLPPVLATSRPAQPMVIRFSCVRRYTKYKF